MRGATSILKGGSGASDPTGLQREELFRRVAEAVLRRHRSGALRIGVDGPSAAGKSCFARLLATELAHLGRHAVPISIDGFHNPAPKRYAAGEMSPEGYYRASFDYDAIREFVLTPFGPSGDRRYLTAVYDLGKEAPTATEFSIAPDDAVLVFEGVMLQRPELRDGLEICIYLHIDPSVSVDRMLTRAGQSRGGSLHERLTRRYLPAQALYVERCDPFSLADLVIDNSDYLRPQILLDRLGLMDVPKNFRGRSAATN